MTTPLADWGKLEHGGCTDAQFVTESNGRISELSADIESSCCHSPSSQEDIAAVGVWTCHCAYSAGAQMNEEEIPEDIEGWVVSVITWVHMLGRVLPHVQKLEVGMRGFESAKHILKDIGFGDTFVAQLVLRTLQEIGFAYGSPILMMGTGAIHMSNRVCNATWTASNINVPQVYELFVALQPTDYGFQCHIESWTFGYGLQPNEVSYTTYSCMSTPVQCIEARCSTSFKQQVSTETGEGAFVEVLGAFAALEESAVEIVAFQRFNRFRQIIC